MEGDTPGLLNIQTLQQLFRRLESTDVEELEIIDGTSRLYVLRDPGKQAIVHSDSNVQQPAAHEGVPLAAPLTGVFYCRPAPDQEPFVAIGGVVEHGQVVALIETMKLFNEVLADMHGELVTVLPDDGDLVEVGQPLMYIRPTEEDAS